jgi:radical SAM protein with 4Fe4S-binding SPASM domain
LTTPQVLYILDQLREAGCFFLGFTGGEPFLRHDFLRILEYARRLGFEVIIYTNGSRIDARKAAKLKALGINKIDITLPGATREVFEKITGAKGSFKKVFRAIDLLRKNKAHLGFKTCLVKDNTAEIKKIQRLCASWKANHRLSDYLLPCLDGDEAPYVYAAAGIEGSGSVEGEGDVVGRPTQRRASKKTNLFKCGAGRFQAAITPAGALKMCVMIDYPGVPILDRGFKEAWKELRRIQDTLGADETYRCHVCRYRVVCVWCPAISWLTYKDFTSCSPRLRRDAAARLRQFKEQLQ